MGDIHKLGQTGMLTCCFPFKSESKKFLVNVLAFLLIQNQAYSYVVPKYEGRFLGFRTPGYLVINSCENKAIGDYLLREYRRGGKLGENIDMLNNMIISRKYSALKLSDSIRAGVRQLIDAYNEANLKLANAVDACDIANAHKFHSQAVSLVVTLKKYLDDLIQKSEENPKERELAPLLDRLVDVLLTGGLPPLTAGIPPISAQAVAESIRDEIVKDSVAPKGWEDGFGNFSKTQGYKKDLGKFMCLEIAYCEKALPK